MARRKKRIHGNSERWLVSYADLLTLLFAFFVVMFASSRKERSRISQAVDQALQGSGLARREGSAKDRGNAQWNGSPLHPAQTTGIEPPLNVGLANAMKALQTTLRTEVKQGQVRIHLEPRGAVISFNTQALFPSGDDTIERNIYPLLAKVAVTLNELPNPIRLEGHTDSLPINNQRFRGNWELSAARSIAMLRILNERFGVGRDRMAIVGYADTNSIGDNQTEEGRMKNRRVDLVLLSDLASQSEPPVVKAVQTEPAAPK